MFDRMFNVSAHCVPAWTRSDPHPGSMNRPILLVQATRQETDRFPELL